MRSMLLMKAVQDCFIGRHFVFGIKVFVLWYQFETVIIYSLQLSYIMVVYSLVTR